MSITTPFEQATSHLIQLAQILLQHILFQNLWWLEPQQLLASAHTHRQTSVPNGSPWLLVHYLIPCNLQTSSPTCTHIPTITQILTCVMDWTDLCHDKTFFKVCVNLSSSLGRLCPSLHKLGITMMYMCWLFLCYHYSPSAYFIIATGKKVLKIKSLVTIGDDLWKSTAQDQQWTIIHCKYMFNVEVSKL